MNGSDDRVTVMSHFVETSQDATRDLNKLVTGSGLLRPFAGLGAVAPLIAAPVVGAVAETLKFGPGDVVVWAWQTHRAIKEAAVATLPGTGEPRHVALATHQITSVHHPEVDVTIDEQPPLTLRFDLALLVRIEALMLTIQRGLLVALSPAGCQLTATLGAHGIDVARTGRYLLPRLVNVGPGLRLLAPSAYLDGSAATRPQPAV